MKAYSLRKSRHTLYVQYKLYQKKSKTLTADQRSQFEFHLKSLHKAIDDNNREQASLLAKQIEDFSHQHFTKSWFAYISELSVAIIFALLIATIVRQSWFELYEIPTGSMRPTFEEQDRLTVTKTAFGLNIPLMTKHFYFDPNLVQRTGVVIWSGEGVPFLSTESTFMGVFPYTKRFIKRCIGKPGDTLYFYGGKVYGLDEDENELAELLDSPWMEKLEHIPFIGFEGRTSSQTGAKGGSQLLFHQFNQLIGRLSVARSGNIKGEIFNGRQWINDNPLAEEEPHQEIKTYGDFWGIRNFAMARLLTKQQVENLTSHNLKEIGDGILYLELAHNPTLNSSAEPYATPRGVLLFAYRTLIPLQEKHLNTLMNNMYTARMVIQDHRAERYRLEGGYHFSESNPTYPGVSNGIYEFYYGNAYQIGWQGLSSLLQKSNPLYQNSAANVQKLFNTGIDVRSEFNLSNRKLDLFPNRYAYFRDGSLYLLGAPILSKDDPALISFNDQELKKQKRAPTSKPYIAFKDYGPPIKDGKIDKEFLKTFGYTVPKEKYIVLGDNHAMSQDSRYFGPIPQANLQGAPSLIIWPPGDRWGRPAQITYPLITLPRLVVWGIAAIIIGFWYLFNRKKKLEEKAFFEKIS